MTPANALRNLEIAAQKYVGTKQEHLALEQSLLVLRGLVAVAEKGSAEGPELNKESTISN